MPKIPWFFIPRTRGFTLIEMMVVLAIVAMIVVIVARALFSYDRARRAEAFGGQIDRVLDGLDEYATRNRAALLAGAAIAGYANPLAPTVAELGADPAGSLLPPGFNPAPLPGGAFAITVAITPAACVPPNCNIEYFVYATVVPIHPLRSRPDIEFSGMAAAAIRQGRGGFSDGLLFRGMSDAWSVPNPTQSAPNAGDGTVGLLGGLGSYRSTLLAQYLRIDGSNQMLAALNVGGNDVINAANVGAQSVTFTQTAVVGAGCATANRITGGASGEPLICLGGLWQRIGWRYSTVGAVCAGAETALDAAGTQLVCRGGAFVALADRLPRIVDLAQTLVGHGTVVQRPVCGAGGAPGIVLIPQDPGSDHTRVPPATRLAATAAVAGANWTITLGFVDPAGVVQTADAAGNPYNLQAVARTHCIY